jgi:ferredoxin
MGDEYAEPTVEEVPEEHQAQVKEAAEECPTSAIEIEE